MRSPTRRARIAVDVVIVALVGGALLVALTGGVYTEPFGVRVSARRPERPFAVGVVLILLRWLVWRSGDFLGRSPEVYRRLLDRFLQLRADEPPAGTLPPGRRHVAIATIGFLAIGTVLLQAQIRQMSAVPDLGDPLFSIWRMGWVYQQLGGDPRPLFDANIFHPTPLTLTLSDSMLLPAMTAAPLFALGLHPVVAYNVLFVSSFLLSCLATYLLLARVTGSPGAAFVGAVFYGFHPYRFEHYSHLELQMTYWMPLALLALLRFAETGRLRHALAAALCTAAQLYSAMYYGVYFPVYAAAVLGVYVALSRRDWRRLGRPAVIAGAAALALAAPLARQYIAAQALKGDRDEGEVRYYSADAIDYLRAHERSAMYGGRLLDHDHLERALFPGFASLALSAVALAPPVGPLRAAFGVGLAIGWDLSRGLKGSLYPSLYRWFPPIRGMRVPARFSVILGLSLAVLAAFGVRRLLAWAPGPTARRLVLAGLITVMALDVRPIIRLVPVWREPPPIYDAIAARPDVVLAEFPFELNLPDTTSELPFMYFSWWHWRQMVNGYSGFVLPDYRRLVEDARSFPGEPGLSAIRARGATHVTVNCALMGEPCAGFLRIVDASPALRLVKSAEWQGQPVRLYELLR